MRTLPDRLIVEARAHRLELGITQQAVADHMGTSQSAVSDIEAGANSPMLVTLRRYLAAVGLEPCIREVA